MATAAVAVAQLGRVEQEEELMKCLVQCVTGVGDWRVVDMGSDLFDEICGGHYIKYTLIEVKGVPESVILTLIL